jgi:putative inorganic carbon (hco3(-)) transporter
MIGALKLLIKSLLPVALYAGTLFACVKSMRGKPVIALVLLTIASPLPNLWYKLHEFPLGKDILDLLVVSGLIGVMVAKLNTVRPLHSRFLIFYLIATYLAVWHTAVRFDLTAPISPASADFVDWKNYAEMVLLYFLAFHCLSDEKQQRQIVLLAGAVLFLIALREARNFTESVAFSYDKRAAGPFWIAGLNANNFGAFVAHFGAFFLAVAFFTKQKYERWFLLMTAVLCVKPLFFSYSRGAYLAALAVLLVFGILKKRSLLVVLGVVLLAWQTLLPHTVVERITMTESPDGQLEESAASRLETWDRAIALFSDNPAFGIGMGGFAEASKRAGATYTDPHNFYIETLTEQGIFGVTLFVLLLLLAGLTGWRLFRSRGTDFQRGIGLGLFGCVVAMAITNFFGDRWSYYAAGAYFWILWGLADRALANLRAAETVPHAAKPVQEIRDPPPSLAPLPGTQSMPLKKVSPRR